MQVRSDSAAEFVMNQLISEQLNVRINVPVWHGHAEITEDVFLGVSALLMTDEHEAHTVH